MSEPNESGVAGGTSKKLTIAGWVVGVLPMAMLTLSSVMKFLAPPQAVDGFKHLGWKPSDAMVLGVVVLERLAGALLEVGGGDDLQVGRQRQPARRHVPGNVPCRSG